MTDHQQLYVEYRGLSEQLKKVQEYLEHTTKNLGELDNLIESIGAFGGLGNGASIRAPVANGIFVDATLNSTALLMNVGGGVVVEKTPDEAQEMLRGQRTELEAMRERAMQDHLELHTRMKQIEAALEK